MFVPARPASKPGRKARLPLACWGLFKGVALGGAVAKFYQLKALSPLLALKREELPLRYSFDRFGDATQPWLVRWIVDSAGFWLQVNDHYMPNSPLSQQEFQDLSGFNPDDLEHSYLNGIGYRYGFPGGKPILPLPFTAIQLFEFDRQLGGVVRDNFCLGEKEADSQLAELEQSNPEAAELARIIFSGVMPEQQLTTPSPAPAVNESASDGVEPDKAGPAKPLQRTAAQDFAILYEIEKQGFDPLALPKNSPGKPGVKAAIRAALSENSLFTGGTVFDKAWERMTAHADIAIQD